MSRSVAAALLGTALSGVAFAGTTAPAQAMACSTLNNISYANGVVSGARTLLCNPPGTENPLPTTIQRKAGTGWVTVTPTGDGAAWYPCTPTSFKHTFRLKEATWRQVSANCR